MRQRGVSFANVFNFRDLGGYRTADGATVRWHRLYRSDDLARLGDDDWESFAALGIRTVVDLRRPAEIDRHGRIPAARGSNGYSYTYHHLHLVHTPWPYQEFADTTERIAFVRQRYREFAVAGADAIAASLALIADAGSAPLVIHCAAGKDRTGVVAALVLALLGVPDEDIAADYALSELAEPASWDYYIRRRPELAERRRTHFTVSPAEAMHAFLLDLRADHGSVASYAESLGITGDLVASMRAHLLDPP